MGEDGRIEPLRRVESTVPTFERLRLGPGRTPQSLFAAAGRLEVRLTQDPEDIAAAQALRYRVFYEEMGALASATMAALRRDFDEFDSLCDHLLVIDHSRAADEAVVGTYRLLRQEVAEQNGGFYSAGEYDLGPLLRLAAPGELLELGRSCVHPDYRTNATIQLLWRGLAGYAAAHAIEYLFGCASLPGSDARAHEVALSLLYHDFLAPPVLRVKALPERFVEMNMIAREGLPMREARRALSPLIRGYLRLGAFVGNGAVIDRQFGTTDVFVLLPIDRVAGRYQRRFQRNGDDAARP